MKFYHTKFASSWSFRGLWRKHSDQRPIEFANFPPANALYLDLITHEWRKRFPPTAETLDLGVGEVFVLLLQIPK